jgi:hypothetical protein
MDRLATLGRLTDNRSKRFLFHRSQDKFA